ncbi:glycosyltransferase [Sphingobium chlorophenolicum]|uniref:Putative glycosyltransferase n=1 Tax=Sphingobium chlorophenolicum TaxID=46429 RepID=A0A081R9C3_SPHCR|nr:hypothetical protein [Sphingobium chlorophenolicum]KEQ51796.1 putative glycosyltransferase [Sphingobium chlorophenolicum]
MAFSFEKAFSTFRELWEGVAIFVDARDARGFAHAIEDVLHDGSARLEAGQAAQVRARRYAPAAMASRMAAQYAAIQRRVAA